LGDMGPYRRLVCENTNCESGEPPFYRVKLTDEFDGDICIWCEDCVERDNDMVEASVKVRMGRCAGCENHRILTEVSRRVWVCDECRRIVENVIPRIVSVEIIPDYTRKKKKITALVVDSQNRWLTFGDYDSLHEAIDEVLNEVGEEDVILYAFEVVREVERTPNGYRIERILI